MHRLIRAIAAVKMFATLLIPPAVVGYATPAAPTITALDPNQYLGQGDG